MPSRSPTRQITDCGIGLQTLPDLSHHPQTQIEQGALCSPRRNAERSLASIRLRYRHTPHRIGPVRLRDQFLAQARQPAIQARRLDRGKGHSIRAWRTRIGAGQRIAMTENVLAIDLVVEHIEAEGRLRLRLAIQLSLKDPDLLRCCEAHRQSPSPLHLRKRTRSQGPFLHRRYPASTVV